MGKSLKLPLDDDTLYVINVDHIVSAYVASATTFNVSLSNSSTPVVFLHETDNRHLVFNSFIDALDTCNSTKSGGNESWVKMNLPNGFTLELG